MGLMNYIKSRMRPPKQAMVDVDIQNPPIVDVDIQNPNFVEVLCSELGLSSKLNGLMIDRFAINVAVNLLAGLVSKCEFKTLIDGKPVKGREYYLWNYEPNINQNSTQFLQELIYRLCQKNECLVIEYNNQLIIAESFSKKEYALLETKFEQVTRAGFTFNKSFYMSDVLYFKLNNDDIAKQFSNLYAGLDKLISEATSKYIQSGGEKVILNIDSVAAGNPDYEQVFADLMTQQFKQYFESKNAVLPLHSGYSAQHQNGETSKKAANEIADIKNLTAEAMERVGQAFKIPPAILKGDIADVDKLTDNLLTFGVDPLCDMVGEEIVRKRFGQAEFIKGNYVTVDTTCIKHFDIFSIAEKIDKLIASGAYCIDELREKLGETPLDQEFSQKHYITKNYQDIKNMEGGETQ